MNRAVIELFLYESLMAGCAVWRSAPQSLADSGAGFSLNAKARPTNTAGTRSSGEKKVRFPL
jgi:hypothetical protein